jgi:hypothetical protein
MAGNASRSQSAKAVDMSQYAKTNPEQLPLCWLMYPPVELGRRKMCASLLTCVVGPCALNSGWMSPSPAPPRCACSWWTVLQPAAASARQTQGGTLTVWACGLCVWLHVVSPVNGMRRDFVMLAVLYADCAEHQTRLACRSRQPGM